MCSHPSQEGGLHQGRGRREQCFSEWRFVNVLLSAVVISVAISVRSGGALYQAHVRRRGEGGRGGEGSLGSDRVGTLSVVRKHELMPRFP